MEPDARLMPEAEATSKLVASLRPRITDPKFSDAIETAFSQEEAAQTTAGPHRLTFVVPWPDDTVLSLGQKGPLTRIADIGITGRTKSHIHWHVTEGVKTIVSLGGGASSVSTLAGSDSSVPQFSTGYAMVTESDAWQESTGQHTIIGSKVRVSATKGGATFQADAGPLDLFAKGKMAIASGSDIAIVADAKIGADKVNNRDRCENATGALTWAGFEQDVLTIADAMTDASSWFHDNQPWAKEADASKAAFVIPKDTKWRKAAFDAANSVGSLGFGIDSDHNLSGRTTVGLAASYVGANADIAAQVYGVQSACIASLLNASVIGGYAASMKALCVGIYGAMETNVVSFKDMKVESYDGTASLRGYSGMQVTSCHGPVVVQGRDDTRLSSVKKRAIVKGAQGVLCIGGDSTAYGMYADRRTLRLGKLTDAYRLETADFAKNFEKENTFYMAEREFEVRMGDAYFALRDGQASMASNGKAATLKIDGSGQVDLTGSKFHIG